MDARRDRDQRPSPDALLAEVSREGDAARGRLKIFLGAAPGVGKTYEMLTTAQAKARDGVDLVVGVVETHGRAETEALLKGLELVPRRLVSYKGGALEEMDLDAILARRPRVALVDELAHTNAPGSRHPKRYQDVEELLSAGISIYATLNIQHVESLNDIVAQITRIRVRETVPDSILERADDIELIDLTPEDLVQRLKEGKVYVPHQAERALQHYFSPGNLTALRELALRRTAQRVDAQLLTHMRAHAIAGPWAAGERVLVCISEDPRAAGLVRYAKRLADRLRAPWTALSIETRRSLHLSNMQRDRVADTLRLADRLGGEAVTVPSARRRVADDVIAFAQENNVTHIIIGKSDRSPLFELMHGSIVHDLVRRSGSISVHVIAGDRGEGADLVQRKTVQAASSKSKFESLPYILSAFAVAAALGVAQLVQRYAGLEAVSLVFLTAVVTVAVRYGLYPSLLAVVGASLCYNFFFLPPVYTFSIADPTNIASLFFFTIVAVLVSNLASRTRSDALIAQGRAHSTEALYGFSRKLAGCGVLDDVLWATVFQIASMLKVRVVLLMAEENRLVVSAGYPPEDALDEADLAAARWSYDNNSPAGRGADTLPGAKRLFLPMRTGRGMIGILGVDTDKPGPILSPEGRRLFDALADQGALAIERVRLVEDLDRAKLQAETDRLRQALLSSISHDLKTPLASVLGAASVLRDVGAALDDTQKFELLSTVIEEAERLNRFIANLLDMTKIEAGAIAPNLVHHDVADVVSAAIARSQRVAAAHPIRVAIASDLPPLTIDAVLFEQVLFNLLDNAGKYSADGASILIKSWVENGQVRLQILDEGEGIPSGDLERVFDTFYRARKGDSVRPGTGLGLAIARGFVEAMGGRISADNRSDQTGAVFTLVFPAPMRTPSLSTAA